MVAGVPGAFGIDLRCLPPAPDRLLSVVELLLQAGAEGVMIRWGDTWPNSGSGEPGIAYPEAVPAAVDRLLSQAGVPLFHVVESLIAHGRAFEHLRRTVSGGSAELQPAVCSHLAERVEDIAGLLGDLSGIVVATGTHLDPGLLSELLTGVVLETRVPWYVPAGQPRSPELPDAPPARLCRYDGSNDVATHLQVGWGYTDGWCGRLRTPVWSQIRRLGLSVTAEAEMLERAWDAFAAWRAEAWDVAADAYGLICMPEGAQEAGPRGCLSRFRRLLASGRARSVELRNAAAGVVERVWVERETERELRPLSEVCSALGHRDRHRRRSG